jgi:hypothetical protein
MVRASLGPVVRQIVGKLVDMPIVPVPVERIQPPKPFPAFFDPAWLYLVAGLALLAATVLVSAQVDLEQAQHQRDVVLAVELHREQRLDRYKEFLAAIDARQPALVESLAGSQLNQIPATRAAIPGTVRDNAVDASVFPALEPPPLVLPAPMQTRSMLTKLATQDATRLWLLAGSAVLILVGLLPASKGFGKPSRLNPLIHHTSA